MSTGRRRLPSRRLAITALIGAIFVAVTASLFAFAVTGRTYRVAWVHLGSETREHSSTFKSFLDAMADRGYVTERNLILDRRNAEGDMRRVPALVDELIALKPDVLVGWESIARVMREKTTSIPIVLAGAIDPVTSGLAQSLRRPRTNVTGVAQLNDQLPAKHIEIMREINPHLRRVGQFVDTTAPGCKVFEQTARQAALSFGVVIIPYYVANRGDIERAFSQMAMEPPDMLIPCPSPVLYAFRGLLFESAVRLRIPFTSFIVANVPQGVLFAYATDLNETYKRVAIYVDKILKGAKPGELPIEQPTNFALVINLKTAKALGRTIPPSVMLRADRIIE